MKHSVIALIALAAAASAHAEVKSCPAGTTTEGLVAARAWLPRIGKTAYTVKTADGTARKVMVHGEDHKRELTEKVVVIGNAAGRCAFGQ